MLARTVVLAVLAGLLSFAPQAFASPPPEPPPVESTVDPVEPVQPKLPRSTKGVALITIGGIFLAGGVASFASAGVIGFRNPFETPPEAARRWTPTFAFAPNGGQVGVRLQF